MSVQHTEFTSTPTLRSRFSGIGSRFMAAMERYMELQSRSKQIEKLMAKSDEDLAKMGITRDRIVYYVFRDRAWF
ncbi:hypothetical protein [Paracoccus sp. SCSIO 75233]|uniref:hypothetical protein n=1 Tax=Paracoccus sp. SCSIO 75233 TaxID=3017782 RepID=UPI0022EFFDA1|nr:hypothetical protein [Paracoccus sp. SCSIO 75233]WBU54517.1 hypothetical protein PAF12_06725 [Paracoccus sp. SCSIO 75233]